MEQQALVRPESVPRPPKEKPSPQKSLDAIEKAAYRMRLKFFELSRNVSGKLTSDLLEAETTIPALISSATKVEQYADQMIATINDRFHPPLSCKEGCSYCCRKPGVLVTVPELLRVLEYVRKNFSEAQMAALSERVQRYVGQVAGRDFNSPIKESVPCPLLVEEKCSVYESRPLVCRGYNSTDVNACRAAHDNPSVMVPIYALIKDVADGATVGMEQDLQERELGIGMVDLGRSLAVALEMGGEFEKSILEHRPILQIAERPGWSEELLSQIDKIAQQVGFEG